MVDYLDLMGLGIYSLQYRNSSNRDMLGRYGFTLSLDSDFANDALAIEVTRPEYRTHQKSARAVLSDLGLPSPVRGYPPITLIKSRNTHIFTGLVNFCTTPGSVHDLMLEPCYLEVLKRGVIDHIDYRTVNVNDSMQSEALLQMWQKWLETIAVLTFIGDKIVD